MHTYTFEKLEVWKLARRLVVWIYNTTNSFPKDEKFGLAMQLRRASVSVVSNLAEGTARNTPRDQSHFTQVAYSSLIEILNQLIISNDLNFVNNELLAEGRERIEQLSRKTAALRNSQLKKSASSLNPKR
jgi:four helix bundle protein